MENWAYFSIMIGGQLLFFLFVAYQKHLSIKFSKKFLIQSIIVGLVFGILFDLVFGKYFGIFNYRLGFGIPFLICNGILSYGVMSATVLLLRKDSFLQFYLWTILLGLVYEFTNYFAPVWTWTFAGGFVSQEIALVFAAYCGLSILLALVARLLFGIRFRALPF